LGWKVELQRKKSPGPLAQASAELWRQMAKGIFILKMRSGLTYAMLFTSSGENHRHEDEDALNWCQCWKASVGCFYVQKGS